jgi:hypothetical protein
VQGVEFGVWALNNLVAEVSLEVSLLAELLERAQLTLVPLFRTVALPEIEINPKP